MNRHFSVFALVLLCSSFIFARTIHVPTDYPTIQTAINASQNGDIVIVADGVYTGSYNRHLELQGKAIILKSENGPENCIIDPQLAAPGFFINDSEDYSTIIWGFTIRNGKYYDGGGFYLSGVNPTIRDCIIQDCIATGD